MSFLSFIDVTIFKIIIKKLADRIYFITFAPTKMSKL